tara:strand:+ start:1826 stop:3268 length:1443 start_codon:yes stop_codon:yes gene_type:complete
MDVTREKADVFGQIAALRVSSEGYPKISISNSLPSISQSTNSLNFLVDLAKALIGFESLKETLVDVLTHNLDDIEVEIKKALKIALKELVSCGIDPSLPDSFVNDGIDLELRKIDLLDMFKVNPISDAGKLLYNDVNTGSNSTDFNTFLFEVIQDNGGTSSWGNQTLGGSILDVKFNQEATNVLSPNNVVNLKPNPTYPSNKLTDFNNDYIDSIKLLNTNKLINSIIESIFGTISLKVSKTKRTIESEIKIQEIIDRIINADEDVVLDNSFFQFSNEEISNIEFKSEMRRKGINIVTTCDNVESTISFDSLAKIDSDLNSFNNQISTPELIEEKTTIVRNSLDLLGNESASNVTDDNKFNIQLNFIESMLKTIMNAIVGVIVSPKLISILALNHNIVYGTTFDDVEDFMKKNKVLITTVLSSVREAVISIILERVLREVKTLVSENIIKTQIERVKGKKAQLASLVGSSTDVLRSISGLI